MSLAAGHGAGFARAASRFERARSIADAVLYEGYVLYPYRASARKNQIRWQFGVIAPRAWSEAGGCEPWWTQTETLVQASPGAMLFGKARCLQIRRRRVERLLADGRFEPVASLDVGGTLWTAWEEGIEREIDFDASLADVGRGEIVRRVELAGVHAIEPIRDASGTPVGRLVRDQSPVVVEIRLALESVDAARPLARLRLRIENVTPVVGLGLGRDEALGHFLVAVHTFLALEGAAFLSLADPPAWASEAAAACRSQRGWPVLAGEPGESGLVLATPILLEDHPRIAPESPGDLCDATEIDEILLLRTMTLTDEEKREARATDARAAAIIDRVDSMPPDVLERLHGAIRELRPVAGEPPSSTASTSEIVATPDSPWWDPAADASVDPETDAVEVGGVRLTKGSRVRLRPGARRADAQDMFLAGRTAIVQGVFLDVEDRHYLAVSLEDDPAAELQQWHGRFFYFAPDEIEPLEGTR